MKSSTYGSDRGRPKTDPRPNQLSIWSGQTLHETPARVSLHRVRPHITRLSRLSISVGLASNPHFGGSPYTYSVVSSCARGVRNFLEKSFVPAFHPTGLHQTAEPLSPAQPGEPGCRAGRKCTTITSGTQAPPVRVARHIRKTVFRTRATARRHGPTTSQPLPPTHEAAPLPEPPPI
jgi:hypothetical protein